MESLFKHQKENYKYTLKDVSLNTILNTIELSHPYRSDLTLLQQVSRRERRHLSLFLLAGLKFDLFSHSYTGKYKNYSGKKLCNYSIPHTDLFEYSTRPKRKDKDYIE